ncbi:3'(2'),5'-bisphosphate nucleotidase CysQ [Rhodococcus olei]|uniref:3'(2'),5'-bisphosphate nucleotidase CysQ n=1 Tax=Rhodococcus olei TaxID=2161675 RepID=A0ABP8P6Q3_9NOCA
MSSDARLAAELAAAAGRLLLEIRTRDAGECDPRELGRRGDAESNTYLLERLAAERPADEVLSEESADSPARLGVDRVWIIDPLDGTREFGLPGRTDWAVHVALWEAGRGVTAAAVAQPAIGVVHASDAPVKRVAPERDRLRILVSDSRPPAFAPYLAEAVPAELVPMGSAGAKAMAVVRGDADAYVHAGGQWEWDSAAPVGVALASGLHCSRIDGSPLTYNQPHPYLPDLLICHPDLADRLLTEIDAAAAPTH